MRHIEEPHEIGIRIGVRHAAHEGYFCRALCRRLRRYGRDRRAIAAHGLWVVEDAAPTSSAHSITTASVKRSIMIVPKTVLREI